MRQSCHKEKLSKIFAKFFGDLVSSLNNLSHSLFACQVAPLLTNVYKRSDPLLLIYGRDRILFESTKLESFYSRPEKIKLETQIEGPRNEAR